MAIEGEVMTIHQKIAEAHKKHSDDYLGINHKQMRTIDAPKVADIDQIKQMLQYILDKLHGMDTFLRTFEGRPRQHNVVNGEVNKPESIPPEIAEKAKEISTEVREALSSGKPNVSGLQGNGGNRDGNSSHGSNPIRQGNPPTRS